MKKEEVKKFADLARIEVSDTELSKMTKDIESILDYVGKIKSAPVSNDSAESRMESANVRNVFREDSNSDGVSHKTENKKKLLDEAPNSDGEYVVVKKIL